MVVTHLCAFLAVPHGLLNLSSLNWATAVKALKPKHRPLGNSLLILNLYYLSCLIFVSIFKV